MQQNQSTQAALEKRRDEINQQLARVNERLGTELDRDPEEQAIQIEQDEVTVSMEQNLRRELADIEDRLLDLDADK